MKLKYLLYVFFFVLTVKLYGQQLPQFSQYMLNQYIINPAVGGTSDAYDVKSGYRNQWSGFKGAPNTFYITAYTQLGKHIGPNAGRSKFEPKNTHGLGFRIINDVAGPLKSSILNASYAYIIQLNKKIHVSLGVFMGVEQLSLDEEELKLTNPNTEIANGFKTIKPDLSLGLWMYSKSTYVGLSSNQLYLNNIGSVLNKNPNSFLVASHYFATAGASINLNSDFKLLPSVLLKYSQNTPVSIDLNSKICWDETLWAGFSFRGNSELVTIVGASIQNGLNVYYSYDMGINSKSVFKVYSTHEITIGLKPKAKGRLMSPSDFW
jgi:type IX secretion system PorP/SprF family membrane protein